MVMNVDKFRAFNLEELREFYRRYLESCNLQKNTIQTSSNDTFYLWRNSSKEIFWDAVTSDNFEQEAREKLIEALRVNSKGDPLSLVNSYMSHLRRFRKFLVIDGEIHETKNESELQIIVSRRKSQVNITPPSTDQVEYYLNKWDELENYHLQEDALDKLFIKLCPYNTSITDILIKVATLNDFYSTNIFSVYPVAEHILSLNLDDRLKAGDMSLVGDIQKIVIDGAERNFYSFATKYCSHHNPLDYPIYDSYVDKVLRYFRNQDGFSDFANEDLKDYIKFKRILTDFKKFYGLDQYSMKQLDRYIWQLGKEYFPKKYYKKK